MKSRLFLFLMVCAGRFWAQDTLVYWNFDNSTATPTSGIGTLKPIGGVTFSSYAGGNPSSGKGYNTSSYPQQLQRNKTAGVEVSFASLGYENIQIRYDHRHSNTAASKEFVLVSVDNNISFSVVDSFTVAQGDTWFERILPLSIASNSANVTVRVVSAFSDSSGYKASNPASTYAASGTWRFDNIRVTGEKLDTGKPRLAVSLSSDTASEKNQTALMLYFQLSDTLEQDMIVRVNISGSQIDTLDYKLLSRDSVRIFAGSLRDSLPILILNDTLKEGTEFLKIVVSSADTLIAPIDYEATVAITDDDRPFEKISAIQGSGFQSPLLHELVTVEAIVTYTSQGLNGFGGFFIQEENQDQDSSILTSEGLWIPSTTIVKVGDKVSVNGIVAEVFGLTQLTQSKVIIIGSEHDLPNVISVSLPTGLESYENMLVKVVSRMTVTENYNLGRYGELTLSAGGRLFTPSQLVDVNDAIASENTFEGSSNLPALLAFKASNTQRRLILDDGSDRELPNPIPFLGAEGTIRSGSFTDTITGILHYDFGNYRINAVQPISWTYAPRPLTPPAVGEANIKVAAFNVENLFNGVNGDYLASRGATNEAEFQRQLAKVSRAIAVLDADVLGLIELENDGYGAASAIKVLVDSINALHKVRQYAVLVTPSKHPNLLAQGKLGTDAIKVGFIYDQLTVAPLGDYFVDDDTLIHNRVPVAQQFKVLGSNNGFIAVVNHFKSKGCTDATGLDKDQNDGQSCFNARRKIQADSLYQFVQQVVAETQEEDVVILGDLNAYAQEDPIDFLKSKGMVNLLASDSSYSYVFMAETGSLDHALASSSLAKQLTGAAKWHINSDEPVVLGYSFNDPSSRKPKTADLYAKIPFRTSDHDPILLGFYLDDLVTDLGDTKLNNAFKVYPNPVMNVLSIEIPKTELSSKVEIFNETGILVLEQLMGDSPQNLNVSVLKSGCYVLKIGQYRKLFYKQ